MKALVLAACLLGWPGRDRERTMLLRTAVLKDGTRLSP
jgi:hypothetical protein